MSALSPRARDLFARARAEGAPTAAERARLFERVTKAAAPPSAPPPAPAASLPIAGRVLLAIAALGTVAAVSWATLPAQPAPSVVAPVVTSAPALIEIAEPPSPPAAVVSEEPPAPVDAPAPTPERARRPRVAPVEEASDLAAELAILRTAQRARRSGDLTAAITALDEHLTRFPHGILANERDVTRAGVVCESGDLEHGRALALPFASTAWAAALARACETAPGESTSIEELP